MFYIYDVIALILKEEVYDVICPGDSQLYKKKVLTTLLNYVVIFSSLVFYGGFVY